MLAKEISSSIHREKIIKNGESRISEKEWLKTEEIKYRYTSSYPPDWVMRRIYIAKKYKYTCQICGKKGWLGFHIHHKIPLKKSKDNSFDNLIYLCKYCHENQHPHMIERRNIYFGNRSEKKRRHISL